MSWLDYADRDGGEFAYITHGSTIISNSLIKQGGLSFDRYTASGSFLEFGNVSASELSLTLDNTEEWFDWEKGDAITVEIDRERESESTPTANNYKVGTFIIDSIAKSLNTVKVVALDSMVLLDVDFDWNVQTYDITTVIGRVATICGVTFTQDISALANYDLELLQFPCKCRELVSFIAEAMGCCAYFNGDNELTFGWYSAGTITDFTEAVRVSSNVSENAYKIVNIEIGSSQDPRVELVKNGNEWEVTMRLLTSNPIVMQNQTNASFINNIKTKCYLLNSSLHGMEAVTLPYPIVEPLQVFAYQDTTKQLNYLVPITHRNYGLNRNMTIKSVFQPENLTITTAFTGSGKAVINELSDTIDNLSVGGRNMLLDTNAPSLTKVYAVTNRYFSDAGVTDVVPAIIAISDAPIDVQNGARFVCNGQSNRYRALTWYDWQGGLGKVDLIDGEEYTVSAYVRVTSGTQARIRFQYGNNTYIGTDYTIEANNGEWQRISHTFVYDNRVSPNNNGVRIYIGARATYEATVEMCGFQLERGNLMTDYHPAPEETQAQIDEIVEKTSNYFWHDNTGAHVSNVPNDATTGANTLVTSTNFQTRTGTTVDASFGSTTTIGRTGTDEKNVVISNGNLRLRNGTDTYVFLNKDTGGGYVEIGKYATGLQNVIIRENGIRMRTYNVDDFKVAYNSTKATPEITVGRTGTNNQNVYVDNTGIKMRTGTTVDASFGYDSTAGTPVITLGRDNQYQTIINNAEFKILDPNDSPAVVIDGSYADGGYLSLYGITKLYNRQQASMSKLYRDSQFYLGENGLLLGNTKILNNPAGTLVRNSIEYVHGALNFPADVGRQFYLSSGVKQMNTDATYALTSDKFGIAWDGGLYGVDSADFEYPLIRDNGTNLWIGANATASKHHTGGTIISTGYDTANSKGFETITVSVPNATNTGATNYGVWHKGNLPVKEQFTANGKVYDAVSIPTASWTGACSFILPVGTYIINVSGRFNANATGVRGVMLSTTQSSSTGYGNQFYDSKNALASGVTPLSICSPIAVSKQTTLWVNVYQNSGGNLSFTPRVSAIRIL